MSLTSHLKDKSSPVRTFFEDEFPDTSAVVRAAAAALRGGLPAPVLPSPGGIDHGRVGMAVDYFVRFALAPDPCPPSSAGRIGAGMLAPDLSLWSTRAVEGCLARVAEMAPWRGDLAEVDVEELARASLTMATFEGVYRVGFPADQFTWHSMQTPDWEEWAASVCLPAEVADVIAVGSAAIEDHAALRGRPLVCNPTFQQSWALDGADADLITDAGVLVDMKSTGTTRTCSNTDLWQLAGYAFADTHDHLGITGVGLWTLRWRSEKVWTLPAFLSELAGRITRVHQYQDGRFIPPDEDACLAADRAWIAGLRERFAALLAGFNSRGRLATRGRRPITLG